MYALQNRTGQYPALSANQHQQTNTKQPKKAYGENSNGSFEIKENQHEVHERSSVRVDALSLMKSKSIIGRE